MCVYPVCVCVCIQPCAHALPVSLEFYDFFNLIFFHSSVHTNVTAVVSLAEVIKNWYFLQDIID